MKFKRNERRDNDCKKESIEKDQNLIHVLPITHIQKIVESVLWEVVDLVVFLTSFVEKSFQRPLIE